MADPQKALKEFTKTHDHFIGIDSDGCAFPTMEIKQTKCFHPQIMDEWDLWAIEKELRMVAEWVNLYSVHRGKNRFPALKLVFDLSQVDLLELTEVTGRFRGFQCGVKYAEGFVEHNVWPRQSTSRILP